MDYTVLLSRIERLCKVKGVTQTEAFVKAGVGKNFKSNLSTSEPSFQKLTALANYFNVPVEFLTGEIDEEVMAHRAVESVIEWLEDNGYAVELNENDTYYIGKTENRGQYVYYSSGDFTRLCVDIEEQSKDGFTLAMENWERRCFTNTTLKSPSLTEDEEELLNLFRSTTAKGRFQIIHATMSICDEIEKKSASSDTSVTDQ